MSRRAWVNGLTALALVVAGAVTWQRVRDDCGDRVTSLPAAESSTPFLDAKGMSEQPDENRDTLVRAMEAAPPPIGPVLGAVGYHYEQWAQLSAFDQGLGVRTRNNPDFTMLDDRSLRPRWSVAVDTARSTYDAGVGHYLVGTTPRVRLKLRRAGIHRREGELAFVRNLAQAREKALRWLDDRGTPAA